MVPAGNKAFRRSTIPQKQFIIMDIAKKRVLMNAILKSQFSYCPLIWMCHSCKNNKRINKPHEKSLRVIYNDKSSSFDELLGNDG